MQSEWASNACIAEKKCGCLRFAIDVRRVNRISKVDSYRLPRTDQRLDSLNGSSWFSTIDLRSGFWQVAQEPATADRTTCITRKGSFKGRTNVNQTRGSIPTIGYSQLENKFIKTLFVPARYFFFGYRISKEGISTDPAKHKQSYK